MTQLDGGSGPTGENGLKANKVPYDIPQPNLMGLVRYVMAVSVVIAHVNVLSGTDFVWPISSYNAVGGFFALSGFLIYGSYLRHRDLKRYLVSRCKRLLPAYWATVLIFAVLLYFVSSSLDYFGSLHFWKYLAANLSFANFLEPTLPGVFEGQSIPAVNGSLWTMKVEWLLYLSVPVAAWILMRWRRHPLTVLTIIYLVSYIYRIVFMQLYISTGSEIYNILSRQFIGQMMFFYTGVMCYYYFDQMTAYKYQILVVALALYFASRYNLYVSLLLEPFAVSTLVIWVSMFFSCFAKGGTHDNISYNVYLVHFPVIQLCVIYGLRNSLGDWGLLAVVMVVTFLLSWLINVTVEKPIKRLSR